MEKYTMQELSHLNAEKKNKDYFNLINERTLQINIDGSVWTKLGSMISYQGNIKFNRETLLGNGVGNMFKKMFSGGEGGELVSASGKGNLLLADNGKKVLIIDMFNESICVNGNDILAFENSLKHDIKLMKRITGIMAGGLFNVKCQGSGLIAITFHGEPIVLKVEPNKPIITDPNATVAWSGHLNPELKTDISYRTFLGRGNGEAFQMVFEGKEGFVLVQPYEEVYFNNNNNN